MIEIKDYSAKSVNDLSVSNKYRVNLTKLENLQKGEKISIFSDALFKTMFMSEKRIKYSAKLLSYFLDYSYDYLLQNLKFAKNELSKEKEYSFM